MNSKKNRPLYRQLYADMIRDKYPEKAALCAKFLQKKEWIALDVIQINEILFGSKKDRSDVEIDQKHRAYDAESILKILRYQRDNMLSNSEISAKYGLSRNTLSKWKKAFKKELEIF